MGGEGGGIFRLEYPSRRSKKGNVYFLNYRFSFRKLQILISQTTDSHFTNYRFPFRFVPFRFANYSKPFSSCFCTRISLNNRVGEHASRTSQTGSLQTKQLKRSSDETIKIISAQHSSNNGKNWQKFSY